jgi:hypothetical protein
MTCADKFYLGNLLQVLRYVQEQAQRLMLY